jgi:hypothetical protein
MDTIIRKVRSLCAPSLWFLTITTIHIIYIIILTYNQGIYPYCFHPEKCDTYLTYTHLGISIISIVGFTWILNIICSYGYNVIAWLLFAVLMIFRHLEAFSIDISF